MSFEDSVNKAMEKLRGQFPKARVSAAVDKKVVTLKGNAPDLKTKTDIMNAFNALVKSDNTINQIAIPKPATEPKVAAAAPQAAGAPAAAPAGARIHVVAKGDTLSAIAKKYYGDGNKYMKVFDANKDQLKDPDKIQVGQKLRIP